MDSIDALLAGVADVLWLYTLHRTQGLCLVLMTTDPVIRTLGTSSETLLMLPILAGLPYWPT